MRKKRHHESIRKVEQIFHFNKRIADYRFGLLSKRERLVACGISFGMTLYEIARGMNVTHRTIRCFAERIYRKFLCQGMKSHQVAQIWFLANWGTRKKQLPIPDWVEKWIRDYDRKIMQDRIVEVYCGGGVVKKNPSPIGGTWACVMVGPKNESSDGRGLDNNELSRHSGFITPQQAGLPAISNNYTELLAAVEAMERLPDGWEGPLFTDSFVTVCRLTSVAPKMNGIPDDLQRRMWLSRDRLKITACLLDGHPTKFHPKRGIGKRGNKVSRWNVLADFLCGEEAVKAAIATDGEIVTMPSDIEETIYEDQESELNDANATVSYAPAAAHDDEVSYAKELAESDLPISEVVTEEIVDSPDHRGVWDEPDMQN